MATPVNCSGNQRPNAGPSPCELQQLWDKLYETSESEAAYTESIQSWSPSRRHSASVWIGGSSIAQDARDKLRAADEARWRKGVANTIDGSPDWSMSTLRSGTSMPQFPDANIEQRADQQAIKAHQSPSPVGYPHNYMQYTLEDSPLSMAVKLPPNAQRNTHTSSQPRVSLSSNIVPPPLSTLVFNDIFLDDSSSSSPQTEDTLSPTEAPTSATTVYTAETPHTPTDITTRKRPPVVDPKLEGSTQKRRPMTLSDIGSDAYRSMSVDGPHTYVGVGGDNQCLLRNSAFVERAPTPKTGYMHTSNALPELSSFRPTDADLQLQSGPDKTSQKLARALTAPVEVARPAAFEEPAWMRPMHLVDTGGMSIYLNTHDDGPIRHALCLSCFRTYGNFRKVHKHGYELCGRTEVLDSHYWEDDTWPDDSSNDSSSSEY